MIKPTKKHNHRNHKTLSKGLTNNTKLPGWVFSSAAILVLLFFLSSILNSGTKSNISNTDNNPSLSAIELDPGFMSQNQAKAQEQAPHYGLKNQTVNQEQVIINLRDNAYQDGDVVTLSINDRIIVENHSLLNQGTAIPVSLRPGTNVVKIYGVWDGMQNGMGISLSADVLNQGNATNVLFPQNATATFNIVRL